MVSPMSSADYEAMADQVVKTERALQFAEEPEEGKAAVIDRMAGIIRQGLMASGILSDIHTWESLPPNSKNLWITSAAALYEAGYRILTPEEFQAVRFACTVTQYALDSDSEEAAEMVSEAYHYYQSADPEGGSPRDHVEALQGMFGSETIFTPLDK